MYAIELNIGIIKARIKDKGMTIQGFCQKLGVCHQQLIRWENGSLTWARQLYKIADILELDVATLVSINNPMRKPSVEYGLFLIGYGKEIIVKAGEEKDNSMIKEKIENANR